jgi:hypothetical protein
MHYLCDFFCSKLITLNQLIEHGLAMQECGYANFMKKKIEKRDKEIAYHQQQPRGVS